MILGLMIGSLILFLIFLIIAGITDSDISIIISLVFIIIATILLIVGCFFGFINYPATSGSHIGILTAVDLEGVYFRRYDVYLKSGEYTGQSDETIYKIYADETELAEQLQSYLGKKVKLNYGHNGGYIGWKSCGTYHIKSVELVEE